MIFLDLNYISLYFLNSYFRAKILQIFATGLSAQSHKQCGRHASVISAE